MYLGSALEVTGGERYAMADIIPGYSRGQHGGGGGSKIGVMKFMAAQPLAGGGQQRLLLRLMYLGSALEVTGGERYAMADIIPGYSRMGTRLTVCCCACASQ
jgi:cobyrinic acid a,c-diamide synthase